MNALNQLYLLGYSLFLVLLLIGNLSSSKTALIEAEVTALEKSNNIQEIIELKKSYGSSKKKRKRLSKILSNSTVKRYIESQKSLKKSLKVTLKALPSRSAKWLLNKLLNEHIALKNFKMKRQEDRTLTITMEVLY
jgi:hypothetical protein